MSSFLRKVAVGAMKSAPWLETVATALKLPEKSISEEAAGWKPTKYTGFSGGNADPGMLAWKNNNFIRGSGSVNNGNGGGNNNNNNNNNKDKGDNNNNNKGDNGPSYDDILRERLNQILSGLNYMRVMADNLRNRAKQSRDDRISAIETGYADLQNQLFRKRDENKDVIGKNRQDIIDSYTDTQGRLNKSAEMSRLKNRALARALGIGGSQYQNMQIEGRNDLLDRTENLRRERGNKLQEIADAISRNEDWANQQTQNYNTDVRNEKNAAEREYQNTVDNLNMGEMNFGIDSLGAAEKALADTQARYNTAENIYNKQASTIQGIKDAVKSQSERLGLQPAITNMLSSALGKNDAIVASDQGFNEFAPVQQASTGQLYGSLLANDKKKKDPYSQFIYA